MFGITTKEIIIDQLEARFKSLDLTKVKLIYDVNTNRATCQGLKVDGSRIAIGVTKSETNMLRTMLVSKIKKLIAKRYENFEFDLLIAKVDVNEKTLNLFARGVDGGLKKIEL